MTVKKIRKYLENKKIYIGTKKRQTFQNKYVTICNRVIK